MQWQSTRSVCLTPLQLLDQVTPWQPKEKHDSQEAVRDAEKPSSSLCCIQCQHPVTDQRAGLELAGAHVHEFTNPDGYRYQIVLFEQADCITHGPSTTEFTWFAGYAWQLALCANCYTQLGWRYRRAGEASFYGLIRDRLVEIHRK